MDPDYKYPPDNHPKTKIVCTLGPSTDTEEILLELVKSGMTVARLNMSHGDLETHKDTVRKVRKVSEDSGLPIGLMVDIPGTKYRTGPLDPGAVNLQEGSLIVLTSNDVVGNQHRVSVAPVGLHRDAEPQGTILVDDGNIELVVTDVSENDVLCKVVRGGRLTQGRGVVTPGRSPSQDFPDAKAISCLEFAASADADFVALSTVTTGEDINRAREILKKNGMKSPFLISKVERAEAIDNIDEIVEELSLIHI